MSNNSFSIKFYKMSIQYETGHAINVANCEEMISICTSLGNGYKPSKQSIFLSALNACYMQGREALNDVSDKNSAFTVAVNVRKNVFEDVKPLSTRLLNYLYATDATDATIESAKSINRKIQGKRASKKPSANSGSDSSDAGSTKTISASQQSYDQLVEHFYRFITLLENETSYQPNEPELQILTLKAKLEAMRASNSAIIQCSTALYASRIARNEILYKGGTGMCDLMAEVKKYIKSVFTANSPQYKQVAAIPFKKIRN